LGSSSNKYADVVKNNGKAYGIPANASQVLEIDSSNQTTTLIGQDLGNGLQKYFKGAKANNGKIYAAPFNSLQVLEINP